jgi:tight adherence protein C
MNELAGVLVDLSQADLVAGFAGLLAFTSVLAAWYALVERDPKATRVRALLDRRQDILKGAQAKQRRAGTRRSASLTHLAKRLHLLRSSHGERIRMGLLKAGIRSPEARALYVICKAAAPVTAVVAAFLLLDVVQLWSLQPIVQLAAFGSAAWLGFVAPDIYLYNRTTKRYQQIQKALPDSLDLLVVCAEAGLSLDSSLNRVAEEFARSAPEIAEELALTSIEMSFLPDRREALLNLARRADLPAVRAVVNTLAQTEKYGTPLSQSLRVLSAEAREQRMLRAEEKAARLPATMTVPMIVFILPTLFIVLMGPAAIQIYDNFAGR